MLLALLSGAWMLAHPATAVADFCTTDAWPNGNADIPSIVYPNWTALRAGSFDVWLCDGCGATAETLVALTVVNFGTADNGDIKTVYFKASCGATTTGLLTMTYAGNFTEDSGAYPAWTWKGASPNFTGCADLCGAPTCGGIYSIDVYVDIDPCPASMATVAMGFSLNSANNPLNPGSIMDSNAFGACAQPWYDISGNLATIAYVYKEGVPTAVPGDTVEYTIYYSKPGTAALTKIDITDSLPPYTHYVFGSAVPATDLGWDPAFGPPMKLRWTIPTPAMNGRTEKVTFKLSVDWGNGESFEPGSGDVGAPEGVRLKNAAMAAFYGIGGVGCPTGAVSPPVSTVVKRFMFWCLGDNDVLFSQTYGQPADEMIYSTFIKNISATKTWWDVHLWDTVPTDLDVWGPNCGFDDSCVGWTMTPSGCAPASPGKLLTAGSRTMLTWKLDMPPQFTLELKWKAKVSPQAQARGTVINIITVLEYGHSNIVDGTGQSVAPKRFIHLAPIILPTMYTSYVGYGMSEIQCPGYFLFFEPLNKKTQFEVRMNYYTGAASWAGLGGVSPSITTLIGDCITGFPAGGIAGCKAERVPALYDPTNSNPGLLTDGGIQCPGGVGFPMHWIHKMTSNSPTLWQCLTWDTISNQDNHTYAPATTLSYTGLMHYMWKRSLTGWQNGWGDGLVLINTGMDPYGVYNGTMETTVYLFKYDYGNLQWEIWETYDLGPESAAYAWNTGQTEVGPYRTVSSEGQLIVNQGIETNQAQDGGGRADNNCAYFPTRETGNCVSIPGDNANFYGVHNCQSVVDKVVIGNLGAADGVYRIWRYTPDSLIPPFPGFPSWLVGTSGTWVLKGTHTVPFGLAAANNPRKYDTDGTQFFTSNAGMLLSKVELISGGPIQVLAGVRVYDHWAGGAVMHAATGTQTGLEYWLHYRPGTDGGTPTRSTYAIDVFCSKQGMAINLTSGAGLSVTYTTTGPDQCVAFLSGGIQWPYNTITNYKISVLPNLSQGNVVCQFIANVGSEKGYTAPFLQEGIHYEIIAPPVVYIGQNFWITIIVKDTSGFTKADYNGITSFTSTDPSAKILGTPMDTTNFTWNGCGTNCGVKIFLNVTMTKLGMQTIVAMDTLDGSINGLVAIMVIAADIKLEKRKKLSVAASGDTVQFWICWSNYSNATGYSFSITDAVPRGTDYVPELASAALCGQNGPFTAAVTLAFSNNTTTAVPATFTTLNPGSMATVSARWLRWTVNDVYVNSTGCVCFKVVVN